MGSDNGIMRGMTAKAKTNPKRVVFSDANNLKVLQAAKQISDEGIAIPILIGHINKINNLASENNIDISNLTIIDNKSDEVKDKRA